MNTMSLMEVLILLVIAGLAGSLGQAISGFSRGGCFLSIALGFIGALLGSYLSTKLNLPELLNLRIGDFNFPVIWSIIGAAIFTALAGLLSPRRRT